jgi:hypothetical protein
MTQANPTMGRMVVQQLGDQTNSTTSTTTMKDYSKDKIDISLADTTMLKNYTSKMPYDTAFTSNNNDSYMTPPSTNLRSNITDRNITSNSGPSTNATVKYDEQPRYQKHSQITEPTQMDTAKGVPSKNTININVSAKPQQYNTPSNFRNVHGSSTTDWLFTPTRAIINTTSDVRDAAITTPKTQLIDFHDTNEHRNEPVAERNTYLDIGKKLFDDNCNDESDQELEWEDSSSTGAPQFRGQSVGNFSVSGASSNILHVDEDDVGERSYNAIPASTLPLPENPPSHPFRRNTNDTTTRMSRFDVFINNQSGHRQWVSPPTYDARGGSYDTGDVITKGRSNYAMAK